MKSDCQIDGAAFSQSGQNRLARSVKAAGDEHEGSASGGQLQKAVTTRQADEGGGVERQGAAVGSAGEVRAKAPLALRHPVEHVIHGDRRVDHYAWMREKQDPRVREYLEAENKYADETMRPTERLQEKLYQEMLGRIQQTDLSVPYLLRGYEYYTRTTEGKQYPIYCRRKVGSEGGPGTESAARVAAGETVTSNQISDISRTKEGLSSGALNGKSPVEERSLATLGMTAQSGEEEVLLDLNELAVGHTFMGLAIFEVSDDNRLLAYATDTTGYRQYVLEVKEAATGSVVPFRAERVTSAAWSADGRAIFYVTEDEVTKRSNRLWRHEFTASGEWRVARGDQVEARNSKFEIREGQNLVDAPVRRGNVLIYEEKDERFRIDVERSRSGAYLFLVCNSHTTSEVRYLRADRPTDAFQLVAEREDNHEYYLDHHPGAANDPTGGVFFVRTNSGGRTFRLMTAPTEDPGRARWREVIPNRPKVMLSGLDAFRTHLVLTEREDGLPYLRIVDLTREAASALAGSQRIEFAEPTYHAALGANPEFDATFVRFQYESMVTPRSMYDYEVKTGARTLRKQQPVLGGFDAALYVSERLHANAADGTLIPISLVRRKDTMRDGTAPLLLYGYGSYGLSMPVTFSSNRLSLLDRGFVYAMAHIRGGGELGKPWHDAGRMHHKVSTFTDFIASAEYLTAKRYTSKERLVIEGGSAGGLLMGAVTNKRPDLYRVEESHVPFVDVLNSMLDASLPLTVGEYEEWGNPQVEKDYFYMKRYCPYTNVERKPYPRMLVKTAWNDSEVMYWEAAKYVAKLRAMKTDQNVLLLKTNMGAGHGGASGRYDYLREIAFDYAFVLRELGVEE